MHIFDKLIVSPILIVFSIKKIDNSFLKVMRVTGVEQLLNFEKKFHHKKKFTGIKIEQFSIKTRLCK